MFEGGVGVVGQLATFAGKPWHPLHINPTNATTPRKRMDSAVPVLFWLTRTPPRIENPRAFNIRMDVSVEDQHRGAAQNAVTTSLETACRFHCRCLYE